MLKKFIISAVAFSALCNSSLVIADEVPASPAGKPEMRQRGPRGNKGNMMRRGGDPSMRFAFLVRKELAAYQADPTPEKLKALEKALDEAVKKVTAQRKKQLEKELAQLDKTQKERAEKFLKQVKSGEFKMPERSQKNRGQRWNRGQRGGKRNNMPQPQD